MPIISRCHDQGWRKSIIMSILSLHYGSGCVPIYAVLGYS